MRLHRLTLRDFRGVGEQTLEFADGVTVVVGDNETGKSSLLEALALLFELPDDSKAGRLRAVQPVGRDVGSEVEADLTLGSARLVYRKRWFRQRVTELRVEPVTSADEGRDIRTFTAREAHDEAARQFGEHVDETLWAALVVGQEHALAVPPAGTVAAVLTALDEASGGQVDHGAAVPLVDAVDREYLKYFTRTGRLTGDLADAVTRCEKAAAAVAEAEQRSAEVEHDVARAERLEHDRVVLVARMGEQVTLVQELEARRHDAAELIRRVDDLRRDADLASERLAAARERLAAREALREQADEREGAVRAAVAVAEQSAELLRIAELDLEGCVESLRQARDVQATFRDDASRLDTRLARLRDRADLADLDRRLAAVEEAQAAERAAAAVLDRNSVGAEAAEAVEVAHRELLAARAALETGSPRLLVRRMGDGAVDVGDTALSADAESSLEVVVERDTTISVADVVEVVVRPGEGAAALSAARADAEHHEHGLLADLGLGDVAEVRRAARERADADRALAEARERLTRRLAGTTVEELRSRRDLLDARLAEVEDEPDSGDSADEAFHEASQEGVREALARARAAEAVAMRRLADVEYRESQARKAFETTSGAATAARVRAEQDAERRDDAVDALAAARAALADDTLAKGVTAADRTAAEAAAERDDVEAALAASGVDQLDDRLAEATGVRDQLAAQVDELHDESRRVEGRLEMAGAQGLASALERARADLANAEARRETLERRARAAERLRETMSRHRSEAQQRYAAPLRERIESLGRFLHGPSFGVVLGDGLEVVARTVDGVQLPLTSLSTGAREQLATLVRLAIAGLTATDDTGVPVVLDDALGWSDPGRLQTMGSLLARAGDGGQVILLTSSPDRYAFVRDAHVVRL